MSTVGTLLIIVVCLLIFAGSSYYCVSRHENPPLWWPNWARPGWDKDPDDFTDPSQIKTDEETGALENNNMDSVLPTSANKYR